MSYINVFNTSYALNTIHIILYAFFGAAIKYIDGAFDTKRGSRRISYLLAPVAGLLMGHLMTVDPMSATVFSAIILSSLAASKVDNGAFTLGLVSTMLVVGYKRTLEILPLQFGLLFAACFIDEIGSDRADKTKSSSIAAAFFRYRMALKCAAFLLFAVGSMGLMHFLAVMAFDISYHLVGVGGGIWR